MIPVWIAVMAVAGVSLLAAWAGVLSERMNWQMRAAMGLPYPRCPYCNRKHTTNRFDVECDVYRFAVKHYIRSRTGE